MTRSQLATLVQGVQLPQTNVKHERNSADGYAFLGAARYLLGLETGELAQEVLNRRFRLGGEQEINGVAMSADADYTYLLWACFEFFSLLGRKAVLSDIQSRITQIGCYPDGLVRYSNEECHYVVPNVTACAAKVYDAMGLDNHTGVLLERFLPLQVEGNWHYYRDDGTDLGFGEEPAHLALIVFLLRGLAKHDYGEALPKAVGFSVETLCKKNWRRIRMGTINWGPAFLLLAVVGLEKKLAKRAYQAVISNGVNAPNFRARALSLWTLARCEEML